MVRCFLAFILLAAVTISSAQTLDNSADNRDYKLTVDVQLVQLPVSVMDKHGYPVRGLPQEYFSVYEDKVQQNISLFKEEDTPLSIGLVIDASGSMLENLDRLHTAAMTFVRESNPEDETSIVSFGSDVFLEQDFTGNKGTLSEALRGIRANGDTALYDAVILAAKFVQQNGTRDKKVLLVVSDGEDNKSKYTIQQALKAVGEAKISVYTVGLLRSGTPDYLMYGDSGKKALKQLAEVTGGASFFPKTMNDVEEICTRIAHDLRNQYTIGYHPSNPKMDGSWRKVQVRLNSSQNAGSLKIRTKQGYYASADNRQAKRESMK